MKTRLRQEKIVMTWLHVLLLFAGIYAFIAGFLGLSGAVAWKFVSVSVLLLIPIIGSWFGIRKTKALWQFVGMGILFCIVLFYLSECFCHIFSKEILQEIQILLKTQDNDRVNQAMTSESIEQLAGVLGFGCSTVIFSIRGYVRIKKGQLKKMALEMPAGAMPLSELELWEIPTLLDEPQPLHWVWFLIQYVLGVVIKLPFYWHTVFVFLFVDVFVCIFCSYLESMKEFIKTNQKIANLPVETMQKAGTWILKILLLVLLLVLLPSVMYGKDPIAEAIAGYQSKETAVELLEVQDGDSMAGMESMNLAKMLGAKQQVIVPKWVRQFVNVLMYLIFTGIVFVLLQAIYQNIKKAGTAFSEEDEDEILFLHEESETREALSKKKREVDSFFSPNKKIRRLYKKTIQKADKIRPIGTETPAELEEKAGLSKDFKMQKLHTYYEKARYSRDGCTKEEADKF